jgi:hypothetical protein
MALGKFYFEVGDEDRRITLRHIAEGKCVRIRS